MTSGRNRSQVSEHVVGLCSGYMRKCVGDELAYFVLTVDLVDGQSGTRFATSMPCEAAARALREVADMLDSGAGVGELTYH